MGIAHIMKSKNLPLLIAAFLTGLAALLHVGCIVFGASWYRAMGAGEQMAQMAEAGHWYPAVVTLAIALILGIWSLYALSGAGVIFRLPLLRIGLCVIASIFTVRGLVFTQLMPYFPGNSMTFWLVSSGISLGIGALFILGIYQSWSYIGSSNRK